MKNRIYIIGLVVLAIGVSSCSDFLKESSQDEVRPSTANDLEQLLLGEGYARMDYFMNFIDLMTDDVDSYYPSESIQYDHLIKGASVFSWDKEMFEKLKDQNVLGANVWQKLYGKIKGCNVILDMLEKVDGTEAEKLNLEGQALALRAFYYFLLVNLYGQPYNAEGVDIAQSPGVPLVLKSAVKDDFPARASVAQVYSRIEEDLLKAAPLIEKYGQKNYVMKVTDLFVHTILSRMYLYMENWEKAIEHADYVIERKPVLVNLASNVLMEEDWWGDIVLTYDKKNGGVYNLASPELIWGYSGNMEYISYFDAVAIGASPAYCVSGTLSGLYDENDLRLQFYYQSYMLNWFGQTALNYGHKSYDDTGINPKKGMRVAELYLNRAEANIRLYLKNKNTDLLDKAIKDLNYLRSHRYLAPYVDLTAADSDDWLQYCKDERRRELSFEDHRWFDLKRYGMKELKHTMTLLEGQPQQYTLPARGDRWVLPIAKDVLDRNPALVQNP